MPVTTNEAASNYVGPPTSEHALVYLKNSVATRKPPHPNFTFFTRFADRGGQLLDIGAHAGQSIAYLSGVLPKVDFVGFEPNPMFRECGVFLKSTLGDRLEWVESAIGDEPGEIVLFVPKVEGAVDFKPTPATPLGPSSRASVLRRQLDKPSVVKSLHNHRESSTLEIEEVPVRVQVIDDLKLNPAFVKIDVEGFEINVLKGMKKTLMRSNPIVMLEKNEPEPVLEFLQAIGFVPVSFDPTTGQITHYGKRPNVNDIFFLSDAELQSVRQRGSGFTWID
ncbi:FkbM family methyltransferase [Sinorhizobium meliloti]|uniref:FkbM family methyltransferase n=1 Tax=Rhizobium meliloti TaxID=382 RepID=UPI003F15E20F